MPTSLFNDFWFSTGGDYILDADGDLLATDEFISEDEFLGLKQQILHRIITEKNGWSRYPEICAGLEQFIGEVIDEDLLVRIKEQIRRVITIDNLISNESIETEVFPITSTSIAVLVWIRTFGEKPILGFSIDLQTGSRTRIR